MVTKLDVLDDLAEIPICVGYEIGGRTTDEIPADVEGLESIKPVYTTVKGWQTSTEGIKDFDGLPTAAKEYLRFQERESGARIGHGVDWTRTATRQCCCRNLKRRSPNSLCKVCPHGACAYRLK